MTVRSSYTTGTVEPDGAVHTTTVSGLAVSGHFVAHACSHCDNDRRPRLITKHFVTSMRACALSDAPGLRSESKFNRGSEASAPVVSR